MKTTRPKYFPAFATALTAGLLTACVSTPKEAGFVSLFDGKSLHGWRLLGKKGDGYGVKDGVIYCARGGGGNLLTEKEYAANKLKLARMRASGEYRDQTN